MSDHLVHPSTGLPALGVLPSGRIVWPVLGGADEPDDPGSGQGSAESGRDAAQGAPAGDTPGAGAEPDWKAQAEKWKALARKHETQAKQNADAAKKLAELEDADKSELERASERAHAAETKADQAEARALRAEVAHAKNLSVAQARRLVGTTKEELEADADELVEAFRPIAEPAGDGADGDQGAEAEQAGKNPRRAPKETLRPGASPDSEPQPDPVKIAKSILDRPF